ncbi:MAG: DUF2382 domain-containing protein [Microcoleus vaginatus WJT46-NPBG5]|jgi:uncharacterized protein (TIGR02271 family)|nr:DUF2382 domain-containing protein [Microcoleus vaginatus WJT46-NPBG5]
MALVKLEDFYPNYRQKVLGGKEIQTFDVYAGQTNEKIGTLFDDVVDLTGRFRYLVIDTSNWGIEKKVLIPIGCCRLDNRTRRVYALGILNKKHIEELPEYADGVTVNYNQEEYPNQVPRPLEKPPKSEDNLPTLPLEKIHLPPAELNQPKPQMLHLYEERLITNKSRHQTGEIVIGKRVEAKTVEVSVPVEKERIVIERTTPADADRLMPAHEMAFHAGEVIRIKIYEETADIHKEFFVREQVIIKKEVERHTVDATATLRREELEVNRESLPAGEEKPQAF